MIEADFALFNAGELVTVAPGCHPAARGELGVIEHGALAARGQKIVWVGTVDEFGEAVTLTPNSTVLNTYGRTVLPGFVDSHTHPVFAGDRSADFYRRALGETYAKQLESGGIMHTVRATRAASEDGLLAAAFRRCQTFLQYGTTTVGARTGYGLTLADELKSLRVLARLQALQPVKIVPSFLGAHVVPDDYAGTTDDYIREIAQEWLPQARPLADAVDVWCDPNVFTGEQCRALLQRARDLGFALTAHASELAEGPGIGIATELGARSVDHAVYLHSDDVRALAASDTVAVLLPGTTFFLNSNRFAPARQLIDAGATVALSTDFNPGTSYTQSMQFILTLAVLKLGMTPEEAIRAATVHGAQATGMRDRVGSLEPGKFCDLAVYHAASYRELAYTCAMNLVDTMVASGKVVVQEGAVEAAPLGVPVAT